MKKTFISPNLSIVKVKPANIICSSCQGQACITEAVCTEEGEHFAKPDLDLDLDLDENNSLAE